MQKQIFNKASRFFYLLLPMALGVLGSSTLYANTLNANTLNANTLKFPENSGWDVGLQALYLKPSYTDGFAYLDDTQVALNTNRKNDVKLDWGWGFRLEGSYHFCLNSDLNLNWSHFRKTSSGTFVFRTNPTADTYNHTPEWDAVNLEFGQLIHFQQIKNLRLHGGLQYARVRTDYHGNGIDPVAGPAVENHAMKFNGIGPRMGADLSVGLIDHFSAYFGGDVAMLVGRSEFSFNETFGTPLTLSGTRPTTIAPLVGLKIGAQYDYAIPCTCGKLVVDAGYQVLNYFNVLHLQDNFSLTESNFALNGWYFGLKWITG